MGFIWENNENLLNLGENWPDEFTGFYDLNKKEIFENDLITFKSFNLIKIAQVKWLLNKWTLFINGTFPLYWDITSYNMDIIGNINENPDILKDKKNLYD